MGKERYSQSGANPERDNQGSMMNAKQIVRVLIVVLAALALTALVAAAQDAPAAPQKTLPAVYGRGESAAPAANVNESEPNNSFGTADYIEWNDLGGPVDIMAGTINPAGDVDYFIFEDIGSYGNFYVVDVDASAYGSPLDAYMCAYDHDGNELACNDDSDGLDSLLVVPPVDEDGVFYITVQELNHPNEGGNDYSYRLSVYVPLLLSATAKGSVRGVAFQAADILAFADFGGGNEKWMLFFDASDIGITKNTNSFHLFNDYPAESVRAAMAFAANQVITDVNGNKYTATPYDVIQFNATRWGPSTSGSFSPSMILDGSTAGLTTSGEKIDAISRYSGNWLSISTTGAVAVPSVSGGILKGRDEDMVEINLSTRKWSMLFDGSTVPGLGVEDVTAAGSVRTTPFDNTLLVIQGNGVVDGTTLSQKGVYMYWSEDPMWSELIFHGPVHGFNYNIDGLDY